MLVTEIISEGIAYQRKGSSVSRKYRCTSGPRKGQVRASPASCNAPINVKARHTLAKTKSKIGSTGVLKTSRTKRLDPSSKRVKRLNKPNRRKVR
tara:strand:+ start:5133 stop:5417 length:285 start_codon:yes stop_codon:yes gene_type:complete